MVWRTLRRGKGVRLRFTRTRAASTAPGTVPAGAASLSPGAWIADTCPMYSAHARTHTVALAALAIALATGCGSKPAASHVPSNFGPPETFHWVDQPIAFATPPPIWRRDSYGNGARRGIWFVKERSGGEAILVAEVDLFVRRDRSGALREILDQLDAYDDHSLRRALTLAHWRTDMPMVGNEPQVAAAVNVAVDRAVTGMTEQDRSEVRSALMEASDATKRLQVRLDDVLGSPAFERESHANAANYEVLARERITVGGEPAERVDYTWHFDGKAIPLREVHVMHGNQMFVASIQGHDKRDVGVFDRLVETITFPLPEPARVR